MSVHLSTTESSPPARVGQETGREAVVLRQPRRNWFVATGRFIAFRVLGLVATLFVSSVVIFGSLYLAPGTPLTFLTHGRSVSPEAIAILKQQFSLDQPVVVQYGRWIAGLLRGDLGTSIISNDSVAMLLAPRAENTAWLIIVSALVVVLGGLVIGVVAGLKPGRVTGVLMGLVTASMAVPAFVAAVVLTLVFAVQLEWFPVFGTGEGVGDRLYHLVLPAISLALASVAFVARLSRAAVQQELGGDHVQTAISRGLPFIAVVRRHVLRNAVVPVITVAGLTVAALLAGSVVVEQVFQLNGLGSYLVTAVQHKDFPVVQAICMIYVASFVLLNTVIDIAYALLDPRISTGGRAR